jgi:hypothetical protein
MDTLEVDFTNAMNGQVRERDMNFLQQKMKRLLAIGIEAGKEPRYHRRPWDSQLLDKTLKNLDAMAAYLSAIETAFNTTESFFSLSSVRSLGWLVAQPGWETVQDDFLDTFSTVKYIVLSTFNHETEAPLSLKPGTAEKLQALESLDGVDRFRDSLSIAQLSTEVKTLEQDEATRSGNILLILRRAFSVQAKMITDCTSSVDIDLGIEEPRRSK